MQKSKSYLSAMLASMLGMAGMAAIASESNLGNRWSKSSMHRNRKQGTAVVECATSRSKVYPGCASHIPSYATPTNYHPR